MSLVNDVLRDLDGRRELPEHGLSFPGLISNKEIGIKKPYQGILLLISFILVVILSVQLIYKKPISQVFSTAIISDSKNELNVMNSASILSNTTPPDAEAIDSIAIEKPIETVETVDTVDTVDTVEAKDAPDLDIVLPNHIDYSAGLADAGVEEKQLPKVTFQKETVQSEMSVALPSLEQKTSIGLKRFNEHVVEITKISIAGDFNYQQAIKEYKQQRYSAALLSIDSAIRESQDEKYQVFKARILLKKNDDLGFLNFIQQQPKNSSLNWFQLVAPGLQLFSYYELSNQYYLQLIEKQPKNIKWPLAMALNYTKLNEIDKTHDIYQSLLKSSLLSMKQKKWVLSQVQNMDGSLNNKEGHRYGS